METIARIKNAHSPPLGSPSVAPDGGRFGRAEIIGRVERRRKWTVREKAAFLAEVESEGGKVRIVARRHRISESLLNHWRSAWKAAAAAMQAPAAAPFISLGVFDG